MQHLPLAWLINAKLMDLGRAKKFLTKSGGVHKVSSLPSPYQKKCRYQKPILFYAKTFWGKNTFFNQLFLKVEFDTKDQVLFYFEIGQM